MFVIMTVLALPIVDSERMRPQYVPAKQRPEAAELSAPEGRQRLLGRALDQMSTIDPSERGWANVTSKDLSRIYSMADEEMIRSVEMNPIVPNPEPSSLLVWAAAVGGIIAAGYGIRRRQVPAVCT